MSRTGDAAGTAGFGLLMLLGLALSIVNVAAIWSLALDVWHWHWVFAGLFVAVLFFLRLDIVLAPLALWGMISAWGWPWWGAGMLVFWPIILSLIAHGADSLLGVAGRRLQRG